MSVKKKVKNKTYNLTDSDLLLLEKHRENLSIAANHGWSRNMREGDKLDLAKVYCKLTGKTITVTCGSCYTDMLAFLHGAYNEYLTAKNYSDGTEERS